jgi:hypothetical protein
LDRPLVFGRENKRACVRDEVGESCFVLVAEAAVCAPLLNAGWGISKLSFGVHPLKPQSDDQALRKCEVESGAPVSDGSIMAISRDCAMKSCRIVLVHEGAAAAE